MFKSPSTRLLARGLGLFIAAAVSIATLTPVEAKTKIASWNLEHLGWENGKDYAALAQVAEGFGLIGVQEVMSVEGAQALAAALQARSGVKWEVMTSDAIGRGSYREMYAFLWRPDQVTWVDGATVYTDDADIFAREPFSARFRTNDGFQFVFSSIHLIYGDDIAEREREVAALAQYRDWLTQSFPDTPVFLAGDFNLPPSNTAWAAVGQLAYPLIQQGATTLSAKDGKFASLYDNIWAPTEYALPISDWGTVEYPQILGISHEQARAVVSDHIPVWMEIDPLMGLNAFPKSAFTGAQAGLTMSVSPTPVTQAQDAGDMPAVVGNKNSKIYHLPGCPGYKDTSRKNRVAFASDAEAVAAGFRLAKNCK